MRNVLLTSALFLACALPAAAQNEEALRSYFNGKYVTVKVDMPASHKGIDLRTERPDPFDAGENASRIRDADVAIREGQRVQVTYVKVKDDLIEFHLAGGGFNWSSDTTTQSFSATAKTSREYDLEKQIKNELDKERKRRLQNELDDLRHDRERRDQRRRREVEDYNIRAHERDMERALRSGSRFNVRFKKKVPPDALEPDGLMKYLGPFVAFTGGASPARGTVTKAPRESDSGVGSDWLRKGLLRADVEKRLGRSKREGKCRDNTDPECVQVTYSDGPDEIEATFVEDVLVRFSVRRR